MDSKLKEQIKSADYEQAIALLNEYLEKNSNDDEAFTMRGMKHWGAGKRSLAINDYLSAVRINPQSKAAQALKAANEILDYRNNDMFNP